MEISKDEQERADLYHELLNRSRTRNSILSTIEIDMMYKVRDLQALRFFHQHWANENENNILTVRAAYNGALILNKDPLSLLPEQVAMVHDFITNGVMNLIQRAYPTAASQAFGRFSALVISYPEQVDFLTELIVVRRVTDSDEAAGILEASKSTSRPLLNGSL
jgi:hypothetical protein